MFITTMSGLRRIIGDPAPARPSLDISDLLKMFMHVDMRDISKRAMWAAISLAFRALLRKSNIVPSSLTNPGEHYLRRGAVSFTSWGMQLAISSSKTVQYQQRVHYLPVTTAEGSPLCAVSLVKRHFMDFPTSDPLAPAFFVLKAGGRSPLTYTTLLAYLKHLLALVGCDSTGTGMHSLRRSGASYMYKLGLSLDDIRQAGDWRSLAALIYLTKPISVRVHSDSVVSKALRDLLR